MEECLELHDYSSQKIHSCQASNDLRFMDGMHYGMVSDRKVKKKTLEGWDERGEEGDEAKG